MAESTILEPSWEKQIDSNCQEFQTWWGKTSFDCERAVSVGANYCLEVLETSESSSLVTLYGLEVIRAVI